MIVCSCHRVTDAAVEAAVCAGASRVGHVVRGTRAGTDCGGCLPRLRTLVEEHFARTSASGTLARTG